MKNKDGCAAALGTFDGLHIGHKALLDTLKENAGGRLSMVCTFSNIPASFFGADVKQLFTPEEKGDYISAEGIDVLFMRKFDKDFSVTPKDAFIKELLYELGCRVIVVGYNYRFGRGGEGTAEYLSEEAAKAGVRVIIVPQVTVDGEAVSSTKIREYITKGEIEAANKLLGHLYSVQGRVEGGARFGRTIGFPTANISVPENKCLPKNGVYAVWAVVDGKRYRGMCNIGVRPTVDSSGRVSVETYIDDFNEDIYGKKLKLEFVKFIRPEVRMNGAEALKAQLEQDLLSVREILK